MKLRVQKKNVQKGDETNTRVLKDELVFVEVVAVEGMFDLLFLARTVDVQPLPSLSP